MPTPRLPAWPTPTPATDHAPPRVVVVAELGVNHDGHLDRALRLVDAAAQAGADAVKLQHFDPDRLLSADAQLAGYQHGQATDARALLRRLALSLADVRRIGKAVHDAGLALVVTLFSPGDVDDLAELDADAVKTASPDAVNPPVLKAATSLGIPMLVSTGTCSLEELAPAAALLRGHAGGGSGGACGEGSGGTSGGGVLLQCVSSYPTPTADAALGGITALSRAFGLPVGYSDHTPTLHAGALAVAAGAVVLEKHLTHDRNAAGPDHAVSLDPGQFADYVRAVREAQAMIGPTAKTVLPIEADVRRVSRQSVCAVRDLGVGHVLSAADLTVKRPGTGIPAAELDAVIGRTLARAVTADRLLHHGDLA